jgi:hypothetical protein
MAKARVQQHVVGLVVILLVVSARGYLLVPSAMLHIVGIQSNPQVTSWSEPSPPHCWHCRQCLGGTAPGPHLGTAQRVDRAGGLPVFASSLVDLYGFLNQIVGVAAVPSIAVPVLLGAVIVWLIPVRNGLQA